jgi:hypothetical protein
MSRLTHIEKIVNSTIPHYSHVKLMPRGLPYFADSLLRGSVRFGKRTGNSISLLNPDNTFVFAQDAVAKTPQFVIETASQWITIGSLMSIGPGKELVEVSDVSGTSVYTTVELTDSYPAGEKVLLQACPIYAALDYPKNVTTMLVKSSFSLANGDVFGYLVSDNLIQSLTEIDISQVTYMGTTTDPFNPLLYQIDLNQPISVAMPSQTKVFIRAFPAYFSQPVVIPNAVFTSEPIGPFLIDTLSGNMYEGAPIKDILSVRTINRKGNYVLGNAGKYVTIERNHFVPQRSLSPHAPMFWELAEGFLRMSANKLYMKVNEKNQFCIGYKCIPRFNLEVPQSWYVTLKSNEACTIRFTFHPFPWQEFTLLSGASTSIVVTASAGTPITDIEINIKSLSTTTEVTMTDWTPTENTVTSVQYNLVVHAIGQATYQSTGVIIKPYFFGSELLKTSYDIGITYDGGKIYL